MCANAVRPRSAALNGSRAADAVFMIASLEPLAISNVSVQSRMHEHLNGINGKRPEFSFVSAVFPRLCSGRSAGVIRLTGKLPAAMSVFVVVCCRRWVCSRRWLLLARSGPVLERRCFPLAMFSAGLRHYASWPLR